MAVAMDNLILELELSERDSSKNKLTTSGLPRKEILEYTAHSH